ncbi:MAG: hypothetical protein LBQ18_05360 [Campylobacteraceae bacterium]|jgi:hypothetical protein|nr:hypothetical protein [Campylobacteraceae bacterium]
MRGFIDSVALDFNDTILDKLRTAAGFKMMTVKNHLVFNQELINDYFKPKRGKASVKAKGKKPQNAFKPALYSYLAILISPRGCRYKITQHKRQKDYTLTFQGLKQYNLFDAPMCEDLQEVINLIGQDSFKFSRLDIAFDSNKPFNVSTIAHRLKRELYRRWNTIYLKTAKEGRTNTYYNVKHYHKTDKAKHICYRLEFSFCKARLKRLDSINEVIAACNKTIQKAFSNEPQKKRGQATQKTLKPRLKFQVDWCLLSILVQNATQTSHKPPPQRHSKGDLSLQPKIAQKGGKK